MKRNSTWRYLLCLVALVVASCGMTLTATHRFYSTAMFLAAVIVLLCFWLYRRAFEQIRLLHDFIRSHRNAIARDRPKLDYASHGIEAEIEELLEAQQMESWKKLTRVLTHEIMNSLSPILSLSETLANPLPQVEQSPHYRENMRQALLAIHRRSKGLMEFVENYRRLTRLPLPVPTTIHADELLNSLRQLFTNKEDESALLCRIHFSVSQEGITFLADRTQMEQALINLIKNAREAGEQWAASHPDFKGADIHVSLTHDQDTDEIILRVQDNAGGIAHNVLERIFVPFFTTKSSGSGIGLSLCNQIVQQHHGRMHVRSSLGQGSSFTITIPRNGRLPR